MLRKTHNVAMLPTEKASHILNYKGQLQFSFNPATMLGYTPQHLYFTAPSLQEDKVNGEEIKDGEWYLRKNDDGSFKLIQLKDSWIVASNKEVQKRRYKLIATTNPELWKSYWKSGKYEPQTPFQEISAGVPKIPLDFVERFVKENGKIEKVDLEYYNVMPQSNGTRTDGKIIDEIALDHKYNTLCVPKLNNNGSVKVFPVEQTWDDIYKEFKGVFKQNQIVDCTHFVNWLQRENYSVPQKLKL